MIARAWNNGTHHHSGAGYGIKIDAGDRDKYFKREWASVILELDGYPEPVAIYVAKDSFWSASCRELIGAGIEKWLIAAAKAPWPQGQPPKLLIEPIGERRFSVTFQR